MSINISESIKISCPEGFSLGGTLMSGQCFRWSADGGGFAGIANGRWVRMTQQLGYILVEGDSRGDVWEDYLDLATDYDAIRAEVTALDPRLAQSAAISGQVRILRQQPWEALCSFVISQNNNIGRIRLIVGRLCELCGRRIDGGFDFPEPETVAALSEDSLTEIGCGYRAGYIVAAAQAVAQGNLSFDQLRSLPVDEARARLTAVRGIGPKVADCALLYGLHRLECFPRDVWIKRALAEGLVSEAVAHSRYAGVAQQFVFEYIRTQKNQR